MQSIPGGGGGTALLEWLFATRTFQKMQGIEGGATGWTMILQRVVILMLARGSSVAIYSARRWSRDSPAIPTRSAISAAAHGNGSRSRSSKHSRISLNRSLRGCLRPTDKPLGIFQGC